MQILEKLKYQCKELKIAQKYFILGNTVKEGIVEVNYFLINFNLFEMHKYLIKLKI